MKIIFIPSLRLAQWQTFTEACIKICKDLEGVEEALETVISVFGIFKDAMLKNKVSAKDKKVIDKERDKFISAFFDQVLAEGSYPHTDENIVESLSALETIIKDYGYKINKLPFNEQTAVVDNMLEEIIKAKLTALEPTKLLKWLPCIKQSNNKFKVVSNTYLQDITEEAANEAASAIVPELRDALEELLIMLFAQIKVAPKDDLVKAYAKIETLVDSMK